jgi:hypothetical protein
MQELEKLLDIEGLADILGDIGVSTVYSNYIKWGIPYIEIGGSLRFSPRDVYLWIESRKKIGNQKLSINKESKAEKCRYINQREVKSGMSISNMTITHGLDNQVEQAIRSKRKSLKQG